MDVTVLNSRVFKAYFETTERGPTDLMPEPIYGCMVVASSIEQAIEKIHFAFPDAVTTSLFCESLSGMGDGQSPGKVVL